MENRTNFSNLGFGNVRLQGPGFSVVSINWQEVAGKKIMKKIKFCRSDDQSQILKVPRDEAAVECSVEGCQLAGIVSRVSLRGEG